MAPRPLSMSTPPRARIGWPAVGTGVAPMDGIVRCRSTYVVMDPLSEFKAGDPISQLLRVVRGRSTVYCRSLMRAPWGFRVEAHGNPAFHVVTSGRCWLEVDDQREQ